MQLKRNLALVVLALLLSPISALAQSAPDAAELTKLLNDFLAGASRNDPAMHDRFWAEDLIYTRSAGRRTTKAEIMNDLKSAPAPKPEDPKTVYTAKDIRIQQYGNTAIVAFRLVATTETDGDKQVQYLLNSGTFLKRKGKWQVVNWQSTRMQRTEAEDKRDVEDASVNFWRAIQAYDHKRAGALIDENFVWTHPGGIKTTRKKLLDNLRTIRLTHGGGGDLNLNDTVTLHGETAIVRGNVASSRYTMTWVNSGGAWKIVAMHNCN